MRKQQLARWAAIQEARKAGKQVAELPSLQGKLLRMKTYITITSLANMLHGIGSSLPKFQVKPKPRIVDEPLLDIDPEMPELFTDPYEWPHLTLCTDHASDNICMEHAFHHMFMMNCSFEHDKDHGMQRMHVQALKTAGLWAHQVSHGV